MYMFPKAIRLPTGRILLSFIHSSFINYHYGLPEHKESIPAIKISFYQTQWINMWIKLSIFPKDAVF